MEACVERSCRSRLSVFIHKVYIVVEIRCCFDVHGQERKKGGVRGSLWHVERKLWTTDVATVVRFIPPPVGKIASFDSAQRKLRQ